MGYTEEHHIFHGSANRKLSEKYGLKVRLCYMHHRDQIAGVHFNKGLDSTLKRLGQAAFKRRYPELNFKEIFGRNYL